MKLTLECPYCKEDMEYIKDDKVEKLGRYLFKCKNCKKEFLVPQDNPFIKTENVL